MWVWHTALLAKAGLWEPGGVSFPALRTEISDEGIAQKRKKPD